MCDVLLITVSDIETQAVLSHWRERIGLLPSLRHGETNSYFDLGMVGGAATFLVRSEMGSGTQESD